MCEDIGLGAGLPSANRMIDPVRPARETISYRNEFNLLAIMGDIVGNETRRLTRVVVGPPTAAGEKSTTRITQHGGRTTKHGVLVDLGAFDLPPAHCW